MPSGLPVLYSFRRCPYAIRARMALAHSGVQVELREVVLRDMPAAMLEVSPKATVPVLVTPDGIVREESLDIVDWALARNDPDNWRLDANTLQAELAYQLIGENDNAFKESLDRYKYAERYPEHPLEYYRELGEQFLTRLEMKLQTQAWLAGDAISVADICIFPFVRQFAHVDRGWFDSAPYPALQAWLDVWLDSELFTGVMQKYPQWQPGDAVTLFP